MDEYNKIYKSYNLNLKKCVLSSQKYEGIASLTSQHFYASILFTRICVISSSINQLSPSPKLIGKYNIPWDFSSVASLTRNLIECYLTFFYLCIDKCGKDEQEARLSLMNLHDHLSRTKMFELVDDNEAKRFKENHEEVLFELKKNDWFKKLSDKDQVYFLKGNTSFFKKNDEIIKDNGENISEFKFMYRFLSSHTHSSPMGFYRTSKDRGRGVETSLEIKYTGICLEYVNKYLIKANIEFIELFKNLSNTNIK